MKRQYSVPEIARRIGMPLGALKRVIRGQDEASPAVLAKLAKDLDMPLKELRGVIEAEQSGPSRAGRSSEGSDEAELLQALEDGLIASARALVQLLRNRESGRGR